MLFLKMSIRDVLSKLRVHQYLSDPRVPQYCKLQLQELEDYLRAIKRAEVLRFFNVDDFNFDEYIKRGTTKHGDINWIIPFTMLAFSSPVSPSTCPHKNHPPSFFFNYFEKTGVTDIVQLNEKFYDPAEFVTAGYKHHQLYFNDGHPPSMKLFAHFLWIVANAKGAVAVHCKAGLGRTGTLIAGYLMKIYRFSATEAICWTRLCRPGSINQIQKQWLRRHESFFWYMGNEDRYNSSLNRNIIPRHVGGIYSSTIRILSRSALLENNGGIPMGVPMEEQNESRVPQRDAFAVLLQSLRIPFGTVRAEEYYPADIKDWLGKVHCPNSKPGSPTLAVTTAQKSLQSLAPGYEKCRALNQSAEIIRSNGLSSFTTDQQPFGQSYCNNPINFVFQDFPEHPPWHPLVNMPEVNHKNFSRYPNSTSITTLPNTNVFGNNSTSTITTGDAGMPQYSLFSGPDEKVQETNIRTYKLTGLVRCLKQTNGYEIPHFSLFSDSTCTTGGNFQNYLSTPTISSNSHVVARQPLSCQQLLQEKSMAASYSSVVAENKPPFHQQFQVKQRAHLADESIMGQGCGSSSNLISDFPPLLSRAENQQRSIVGDKSGTFEGTGMDNKEKPNSKEPSSGDDKGNKKCKKNRKKSNGKVTLLPKMDGENL